MQSYPFIFIIVTEDHFVFSWNQKVTKAGYTKDELLKSYNDSNSKNDNKTATWATKASHQAEKNVKIWNINYNITKNWDTIKFDNIQNWWADFKIKKSEILKNWKIDDNEIKKVLGNANITEWTEDIIKKVKEKFQ